MTKAQQVPSEPSDSTGILIAGIMYNTVFIGILSMCVLVLIAGSK